MVLAGRIRPFNPWLLLCLPVCGGIGALAGVSPKYGIIGALGLMFAVVTFMDLTLGFVLLTLASFLDLASSSGSFTGTKVIGLVVFASWAARSATHRERDPSVSFVRNNPWLVVALVSMVGWAALSFAWARSPSTAFGGAGRFALGMILLPIGYAAMRERRHVMWVLSAFVAGAALSALYGFAVPGTSTRLTGSIGDPNFEATAFVAAIALLIGLMVATRQAARMKLIGVGVLGVLFLGLVTTVSREGLLALAAVMVGAVVFGGRWRRRAVTLLTLGAVVTVGYFFVFAPLAARQRVTMTDTSGRTSIWTVAWRVVRAHPVLGVGTDNFILVEGQYVGQPGIVLATYTINNPRVAHNAYLEALADLGVPGLITFVAVLGAALGTGVRAVRLFERSGDTQMELIARAVVLALVAVLVTEAFVSAQYAKYLWLLIALCPVLLGLARRAAAQTSFA